MKNKRFLLLVFLLSLSLSACSLDKGKQSTTEDGARKGSENFGRPDFGQPENAADISGIVKSISGNEVKILKIERPQRPENGEKSADIDNEAITANKDSDAKKIVSLTGMGAMPGGMPGGPRGERGAGENGVEAGDNSAFLEKMKSMSTGEETVIIPVGIKMLKTERGDNGKPQAIEASLADIKENTMISVWTDAAVSENLTGSAATSSESVKIKQANFVLISQ